MFRQDGVGGGVNINVIRLFKIENFRLSDNYLLLIAFTPTTQQLKALTGPMYVTDRDTLKWYSCIFFKYLTIPNIFVGLLACV